MARPQFLRQAVQQFQRKRKRIYEVDRTQIQRNANAAREVSQDYWGRWFFELLQNADDARAKIVEVRITASAAYVADDGEGFEPTAVESISGTHYSAKRGDTSVRKGFGFNSVYEVTGRPHVFTLSDEGLKFDPEQAKIWFEKEGLGAPADVPYQWIPFFVSCSEAQAHDETLAELAEYSTVVKLPFDDEAALGRAVERVESFPARTLLTLRHLREIRVSLPDEDFTVSLEPIDDAPDSEYSMLCDTRDGDCVTWRVAKYEVKTPSRILSKLNVSSQDRERISKVGILVAAPCNEDLAPEPLDDWPKVHVFYPTDDPAPVPLLLHAEFMVKSDRTSIVDAAANAFNEWLAEQLADHIVSFVNDCFNAELPSAHIRLLKPQSCLRAPLGDQLPVAEDTRVRGEGAARTRRESHAGAETQQRQAA